MEDPYQALNVAQDATQEQLRHAYYALSRAYHPDRHDAQHHTLAATRFRQLSSAYAILSDPSRRAVYDALGPTRFETGLSLIEPGQNPPYDPQKLASKVERAERRAADARAAQRLRLAGSLVVSSTIAHIVEPEDAHAPLAERPPPALSSVAINEEMTLRLDGRNELSLGCQLLTRAGLGGSTLRIGFKRQLSPHASLQAASSLDMGPANLGLTVSRRLSRHAQGVLALALNASVGLASLSIRLSRQLSKRLLGVWGLTLGRSAEEAALTLQLARSAGVRREGGDAGGDDDGGGGGGDDDDDDDEAAAAATDEGGSTTGATAGRRRPPRPTVLAPTAWLAWARARMKRRLSRSSGELALQHDGPKWGTTLTWRHSRRSRSRVALRLGAGGLSTYQLTLSTERAVSRASASAVGIVLQLSVRSVMLKVRLQRQAQRLLVPIFIATTPTALVVSCAAAAPSAVLIAARRLLIEPRKARARLRASADADHAAEAARAGDEAARLEAEAEARMLESEAATRAAEERAAGGLLILAAYYGDVDAALSGSDSGAGTTWLDVRIALQFAVRASRLRLPPGSKTRLRGFAPVVPREDGIEAELWVRYAVGADEHVARIAELDSLELPHDGRETSTVR